MSAGHHYWAVAVSAVLAPVELDAGQLAEEPDEVGVLSVQTDYGETLYCQTLLVHREEESRLEHVSLRQPDSLPESQQVLEVAWLV
jgi:hypothetical protein